MGNANPLPQQPAAYVDKDGRPTIAFLQFMLQLSLNLIGPLTNAANDTAAAAAGVPINGLYRNGNAVQIRLT